MEIKPQPGDTIMCCLHRNDKVKGGYYWFHVDPPAEFDRGDGTEGTSSWIALCADCFIEFPDPWDGVEADYTFEAGMTEPRKMVQ